jgi:hypothetical protein
VSTTAAPDAGLTLVAGNPATVQIVYPIDATGYSATWSYGVYNLDGTRGIALATKTLGNGLQYVLNGSTPSFYLTLTSADTAGQAPGSYWTQFQVYAPGGALDGVTDDVLTLTAVEGAAPGAVVGGGSGQTVLGGAFALTADTDILTADGGIRGSPQPSFATLTDRVLDYLDRPELADKVPMWIQAWQAKLNRLLRVGGLEAMASLVPSPITGGCTLPRDYQAWRSVQYAAGGRTYDLEYATPDVIAQRTPWAVGGFPHLFTIKGQMLFPVPAGGPILLTYYKGVQPYLASMFNDWVLINHYDIYLYGVLSEAEKFLKNDERAASWLAEAATALNDLINADRDARWGRARVMMSGATP